VAGKVGVRRMPVSTMPTTAPVPVALSQAAGALMPAVASK